MANWFDLGFGWDYLGSDLFVLSIKTNDHDGAVTEVVSTWLVVGIGLLAPSPRS